MSRHPLPFGRLALAGLTLALLAGAGLLPHAVVQAQEERTFGDITLAALTFDYDLGERQIIAEGKVVLTTKDSRLTADKMTIHLTNQNTLEWAKCAGGVVIEKRDLEAKTLMTARGETVDYNEKEQKANIQGNVRVEQSSPRLAKPAVITGSRVDMNLATEENIVLRTEKEQAKVRVDPKGEEGKPAPEPIEMHADRIEMKGKTQEYFAIGKPVMVRPTSKLQAKRIRFQVEENSQDVKVAYAEEEVVFDGQGQKGSIVHATGDNGTFNREASEIVLTGEVNATTRDAANEEPIVYQGDKFVYNTATRKTRLIGGGKSNTQAIVRIPAGKAPAVGKPSEEKEPAAAEGGKKDAGKGGAEKK